MANLSDTFKDVDIYRARNSVYGAPRYIVSWLCLSRPDEGYDETVKRLQKTDGIPTVRKYMGKDFGGGIVFESYNVRDSVDAMLKEI